MNIKMGQTLYAINDIEAVVTDMELEDGSVYVTAKRKSDGFMYHFEIRGGSQFWCKPKSYFDLDTEYHEVKDNFFRTKPPKGHRSFEDKQKLKARYKKTTGNSWRDEAL